MFVEEYRSPVTPEEIHDWAEERYLSVDDEAASKAVYAIAMLLADILKKNPRP
jgi:hypothetical protein